MEHFRHIHMVTWLKQYSNPHVYHSAFSLIFIGVQLIYNAVFQVHSKVNQLHIYIHTSFFFFIYFY